MLHIVNGDSVAMKLQQGVVSEDDVLAWREIYVEGALSVDPVHAEALRKRAQSLEDTMHIPSQTYIDGVSAQEKRLTEAIHKEEEIVLWFEHDLFDQTILWYLLYRLGKAGAPIDKLYLLSIGEFPGVEPFFGMGQLSADQLQTLMGSWQPIRQDQMDLGKRAWMAYTSDSPFDLEKLLNQETSALPFLQHAIQFHFSRFPSTRNGLNSVEQSALHLLSKRPHRPLELFRSVSNKVPLYGMGDLEFWYILEQLQACARPLIQLSLVSSLPKDQTVEHQDHEAVRVPFPNFKHTDPAFWEMEIRLTDLGRAVLQGKEDRIQMCGIDKWLGGIHLLAQGGSSSSSNIWRWDSEALKLVK